jgi:hypothetical protein
VREIRVLLVEQRPHERGGHGYLGGRLRPHARRHRSRQYTASLARPRE